MARSTWHPVSKLFHWLMAAAIIYQLWLGWRAEELPFSPKKLDLFVSHKSIGILLFLLVVLRLAARFRTGVPPHTTTVTKIEQRAADVGHWVLYVLMVAVPLSGWVVSDTSRIPFRLFKRFDVPDLMAADKTISELAAQAHGFLTTAMAVVVIVHVMAALRHHFLIKNNTLKRMLPW
ncbi:MAG: cytochrome b [Pseudomonadota bacterium]